MEMIIWSKDRAMQLNALLESARSMVSGKTTIIYSASNNRFRKGYDKVKTTWPMKKFINESECGFKLTLSKVIQNVSGPYVLCNSDDNLFINDVKSNSIYLDSNEHAVSMRLHPRINYCQPANIQMDPPEFERIGEYYRWNWTLSNPIGCWGYPNPCDSNIYRTKWFSELVDRLNFKNPYTLETAMNRARPSRKYMKCFEKPAVINVANNCVQGTGNPCGQQSAEFLNDLWLSGKSIDISKFIGLKASQCHIVKEYTFA